MVAAPVLQPHEVRPARQPGLVRYLDQVAGEITQGTGTIELTGEGTDLVQMDVRITWRSLRGTAMSLQAMSLVSSRDFWVEQ